MKPCDFLVGKLVRLIPGTFTEYGTTLRTAAGDIVNYTGRFMKDDMAVLLDKQCIVATWFKVVTSRGEVGWVCADYLEEVA